MAVRTVVQGGLVMPRNPGMRASDQDREATVEVLCEAYVACRLELSEVRERAGAAYSARTRGDLHGLTADLPSGPGLPAAGELKAGMWSGTGFPYRSGRPYAPLMLLPLAVLAMSAIAWIPSAAVPLIILSPSVLFAAGCSARHRDGSIVTRRY